MPRPIIKEYSCTLFTGLFFISCLFASAQQNNFPKDATQIIFALKKGAILVRLHSKSLAAAAYEKAGNHDMAMTVLKRQEDENRTIMHAFKDQFTFCKVYFFSSDSTENVLNGKRSGYFLNDKMQVDPSIVLTENFFLTGEHGNPDFPMQNADSSHNYAPDAGLISDAFVLTDDHFQQLPKPFPYLIRPNVFDGKDPWDKRIQRLNDNLNNFLERFK